MSDVVLDVIQNTNIAFLTKEGFPDIELVSLVDDKSPVVKTLTKVGVAPYHICYEVDDIDKAIADLKKKRYISLFKPVPAVAINNCRICYLYNVDIGLIEIVEKEK
jgi:methylmalonyl-CoA/ethylmalonyl-CoA epimerase